MSKHIIVTSNSAVKLQAVSEAFNGEYSPIGVTTPTFVEQPLGLKETLFWNRSRIGYVLNLFQINWYQSLAESVGKEDFDYWTTPIISIESGIRLLISGEFSDFVTIKYVTFQKSRPQYIDYAGQDLIIPEEYTKYLKEAYERDFVKTTFGSVVNEHHPEIPANNWQLSLCGVSRKEQIKKAIVEMLAQNNESLRS